MAVRIQGGRAVPFRTTTQLDAMREAIMNLNKAKSALQTGVAVLDAEIAHLGNAGDRPGDRQQLVLARNKMVSAFANDIAQAARIITSIPGYSGRQFE